MISRLKNEFNIAIAEVGRNDVWQSAVIGIAAVGNDAGVLHAVMENVVAWIERKGDVYVANYGIEFR